MFKFENNSFRLEEDKEGIVHSTLLKNFGITENEIEEYLSVCEQLSSSSKKVLIDFREVNYLTPGALKKFSSQRVINATKAAAVLVSLRSPIVLMITSFLLTFSKEPYPVKLFTNEKEAIEWLKSID